MSRWKKEDAGESALYNRKWSLTEKGIAYKKRHAEYIKGWRRRNKANVKAIQQRSYDKIRIECLSHYGNGKVECRCCEEKQLKFLHLDHIKGDGHIQRREWVKVHKKVFGGTGLYYWLKKTGWPDLGLQVLCANCNLGKRTGKYCPHEIERGIDMNGNPVPNEYLPKIFTRQPLSQQPSAVKMRRWRAKKLASNIKH